MKKVKEKREETLKEIEFLVDSHEGVTKDDFSDLLYCYNLLIVAYGSISNTCAVLYYLKEIDPESLILPEEIKDI